jgi:hypothetical protein
MPREKMKHGEAATNHRKAYLAGRDESARTDSEPSKVKCPYEKGTLEHRAFWFGWNYHYDDAW